MIVKAFVGLGNQAPVKPCLRDPALVPCDKDDALTLRIERERHALYAVIGIEPEFLHVHML